MKSGLIRFSGAMLFIVLIIIAVGAFLPNDFRIERTITIPAEPSTIHAELEDLDRWNQWSPWVQNNPTLKLTPGEKRVGVGASQSWLDASGDGEMEITASNPQTGIVYDLWFQKRTMKSQGTLLLEATAGGTNVTWIMEGSIDTPVMGGYFALLMDRYVGPDFENGLASLKNAVTTSN